MEVAESELNCYTPTICSALNSVELVAFDDPMSASFKLHKFPHLCYHCAQEVSEALRVHPFIIKDHLDSVPARSAPHARLPWAP